MCGQISISRLPEGMKQQGRYKVTLKHQDPEKTSSKTIESDPQGGFCFQAKPGDYSVQVRSRRTPTLSAGFQGWENKKSLRLIATVTLPIMNRFTDFKK